MKWFLNSIGSSELRQNIRRLETQVQYAMSQLARQVKRRDKHRHRRERQYNLITAILQASSPKRSKSKLFYIDTIFLWLLYHVFLCNEMNYGPYHNHTQIGLSTFKLIEFMYAPKLLLLKYGFCVLFELLTKLYIP